jgi:hypothetical protein
VGDGLRTLVFLAWWAFVCYQVRGDLASLSWPTDGLGQIGACLSLFLIFVMAPTGIVGFLDYMHKEMSMGDGADQLTEQGLDELAAHKNGTCEMWCPYCDPDEPDIYDAVAQYRKDHPETKGDKDT